MNFLNSLRIRVAALLDKSAWLLIVPALLVLFFIDAGMVKTLIQWSAYGLVLAGVAVVVSRIVFPQIDLTRLVAEVHLENRAAATLAAALVIFVGLLMLSLVIWAKV